MRALAFFEKTFLENLRDWKILVLALVFAPFFVYLMWAYFDAAAPSYELLVLDRTADGHEGQAATRTRASGLVDAWRGERRADGQPVFTVTSVDDVAAAVELLRKRDADLLVEIPEDFDRRLEDVRSSGEARPPRLVDRADPTNVRSSMAMAMSDYVAFAWVYRVTGTAPPLDLRFEEIGAARVPTEFDLYVPALLVLALIMILFTAAATLIKEVDKGTMSRLMLSRLRTVELMGAVTLNQVLIGLAAMALAYLAAVSVGYRSSGSLGTLLLVGAVSTVSVVAIGVLVAAWLRSIFELLTIGCFPFFLLMFFSECMFPLPKITLFEIAGNTVYANDLLPTSLTTRAFNEVLSFGAGPGDILFELVGIALLTVVYFALGIWLFKRRHQRV